MKDTNQQYMLVIDYLPLVKNPVEQKEPTILFTDNFDMAFKELFRYPMDSFFVHTAIEQKLPYAIERATVFDLASGEPMAMTRLPEIVIAGSDLPAVQLMMDAELGRSMLGEKLLSAVDQPHGIAIMPFLLIEEKAKFLIPTEFYSRLGSKTFQNCLGGRPALDHGNFIASITGELLGERVVVGDNGVIREYSHQHCFDELKPAIRSALLQPIEAWEIDTAEEKQLPRAIRSIRVLKHMGGDELDVQLVIATPREFIPFDSITEMKSRYMTVFAQAADLQKELGIDRLPAVQMGDTTVYKVDDVEPTPPYRLKPTPEMEQLLHGLRYAQGLRGDDFRYKVTLEGVSFGGSSSGATPIKNITTYHTDDLLAAMQDLDVALVHRFHPDGKVEQNATDRLESVKLVDNSGTMLAAIAVDDGERFGNRGVFLGLHPSILEDKRLQQLYIGQLYQGTPIAGMLVAGMHFFQIGEFVNDRLVTSIGAGKFAQTLGLNRIYDSLTNLEAAAVRPKRPLNPNDQYYMTLVWKMDGAANPATIKIALTDESALQRQLLQLQDSHALNSSILAGRLSLDRISLTSADRRLLAELGFVGTEWKMASLDQTLSTQTGNSFKNLQNHLNTKGQGGARPSSGIEIEKAFIVRIDLDNILRKGKKP